MRHSRRSLLFLCCFIFEWAVFPEKSFQWIEENKLVGHDGISEQTYSVENSQYSSRNLIRVEASERVSAYAARLNATTDSFELVRSIRVYDDCPGIEWRLKMRGKNTFSLLHRSLRLTIEDQRC